ncbi:Clp protease N-terminal domain-containing protein [Streptomyces sp. NPDC006012]|uniref:Clp protease N-terminal domain-containing protein n=1 Tax=Streptomyces sp. NPDC006012 TaxID=3364739 RepID=UPI0036C3A121
MQPRVPRQPAHDLGADRAGGDVVLSAELAAVVAGARRRAVRDGDRQVDTAHLLHSLLESGPDVRAVIGDVPQNARLFGYLVQRSIGYGLRWQNSVEDSGPIAVVSAAELTGPGLTGTDLKSPALGPDTRGLDAKETDGWSPLAATAMRCAVARAALRGAGRADCTDLLAAIVADPQSRAVEVLGRAGVDVPGVFARIDGRSGKYAADGGAPC